MYSSLHPRTYYSAIFFFLPVPYACIKLANKLTHHVRVPKFQNPPAGSEILPRNIYEKDWRVDV
jgi:hypothetical protein